MLLVSQVSCRVMEEVAEKRGVHDGEAVFSEEMPLAELKRRTTFRGLNPLAEHEPVGREEKA